MARHPAFAPHEIERQRQQMLSGLRVSLEDPEYIAKRGVRRLVYGFHPYGMPENRHRPRLSPASPGTILLAFHARYFIPNKRHPCDRRRYHRRGSVCGGEKVFADWMQHDLPSQTFIEPPDATRRVIVINKPDAVQTEVRVGHLGIPRRHPDYMAVNLAIRILGGEGSNRLHQILRTERGLTYGAQANMDTLKEAGDFVRKPIRDRKPPAKS